MLVTVVGLLSFAIEKIVGRVRYNRLIADVVRIGTALRRREPFRGMHPLDKGGHRQYVVARPRSVFDSGHRKQEPRNGIRLDEGGVGRGDRVASPDGARVLRMLPGGADLAAIRW